MVKTYLFATDHSLKLGMYMYTHLPHLTLPYLNMSDINYAIWHHFT